MTMVSARKPLQNDELHLLAVFSFHTCPKVGTCIYRDAKPRWMKGILRLIKPRGWMAIYCCYFRLPRPLRRDSPG
jgi:hypothetical protein